MIRNLSLLIIVVASSISIVSTVARANSVAPTNIEDRTSAKKIVEDRIAILKIYQSLVNGVAAEKNKTAALAVLAQYSHSVGQVERRLAESSAVIRPDTGRDENICTAHFHTDQIIHRQVVTALKTFLDSNYSEEKINLKGRIRVLQNIANSFYLKALSPKGELKSVGSLLPDFSQPCLPSAVQNNLDQELTVRNENLAAAVEATIGTAGYMQLPAELQDLAGLELKYALHDRNVFFATLPLMFVGAGVPTVLGRLAIISATTVTRINFGLYIIGGATGAYAGGRFGQHWAQEKYPEVVLIEWQKQINEANIFLKTDFDSPKVYEQLLTPIYINVLAQMKTQLEQIHAQLIATNWFQRLNGNIDAAITYNQQKLNEL